MFLSKLQLLNKINSCGIQKRLLVSSTAKEILILAFLCLCIFENAQIAELMPLWQASLGIFVVAWIGQFYGHKLEGAKPSFFDDLKFLLIGPAWILDDIFFKK